MDTLIMFGTLLGIGYIAGALVTGYAGWRVKRDSREQGMKEPVLDSTSEQTTPAQEPQSYEYEEISTDTIVSWFEQYEFINEFVTTTCHRPRVSCGIAGQQYNEPLLVQEPPVVGTIAALNDAMNEYQQLKELSSQELRKLCTEAGIKWRNVRGKNKHMFKPDMVDNLSRVREQQ